MFNTGDLARWLEDGNLDHQGRSDDQVKIKVSWWTRTSISNSSNYYRDFE
jgi:acyl-coenzyme A synthetase/AMP-(fatty) acid ligase